MQDATKQRPKVDVGLERTGLGTHLIRLKRNLWDPEVVKIVAQCDVVFGCMDTVWRKKDCGSHFWFRRGRAEAVIRLAVRRFARHKRLARVAAYAGWRKDRRKARYRIE